MRKLGSLGFVLLGIAFFLTAVNYLNLPFLIYGGGQFGFGRLPTWLGVLLSFVPFVVAAGIGLLLIVNRDRAAQAVIPDQEVPSVSLSSDQLARLAMIILGVYLVLSAVPALFAVLVNGVVADAEGASDPVGFLLLRNLQPLLSFVLGSVLVLRSEAVARWLGRSRAKLADDTPPAPVATCPSCGASYDPADYEGGLSQPLCPECKQPLDLPGARQSQSPQGPLPG